MLARRLWRGNAHDLASRKLTNWRHFLRRQHCSWGGDVFEHALAVEEAGFVHVDGDGSVLEQGCSPSGGPWLHFLHHAVRAFLLLDFGDCVGRVCRAMSWLIETQSVPPLIESRVESAHCWFRQLLFSRDFSRRILL